MASSTPLLLPNFMVLQSCEKDYLSYKREAGDTDRYLKFMESQAVSPFAKFQVELSKTDGLVHIRSCQNNKYWMRETNRWITATAMNKNDDRSSESCTLFKFISVDPAMKTVRIMHVQSECYLCMWLFGPADPILDRCMLAQYKEHDGNGRDIFTLIDWSSLLILPKYVAFKGQDGMYLCLDYYDCSKPIPLRFATRDLGDSTVACEIIPDNHGNIRMRQVSTQKIWYPEHDVEGTLMAGLDGSDGLDDSTLFRPVNIDDKTIALFNLGYNKFCRRHEVSVLTPTSLSITNETRLIVEEAVVSRQIYGSKYDVDNARVYNESVISVAKNSVSNHTHETEALTVKLTYKDTKSRTWKNSFSLTVGVTVSMEFEIPFIASVGIEVSTEVQSGIEWGETEETSTEVTVEHTVVVPPMTMVTVNLVATRGTCDIPLSYLQKDTLYNGEVVTTKILGAYFSGANYYNFSYEDKEVSLPAAGKIIDLYVYTQNSRGLCIY